MIHQNDSTFKYDMYDTTKQHSWWFDIRGTLNFIDFLLNLDKINEQDFNLLINSLDKIQFIDAANLLERGIFIISINDISLICIM